MRILAVDDEPMIIQLLDGTLSSLGYTDMEYATSGEDAIAMIQGSQKPYDCFLLDIEMPGMNGIELCRTIRSARMYARTPILMVTAMQNKVYSEDAFASDSTDYITKPFSPQILQARARAVLRRRVKPDKSADSEQPIEIHDLYIHPGRNKVKACGETIELTFSEFQLLCLLAGRPGWVFTRTQIVDAIHGEGYAVTDRAVDVQIVGLRKKLGSCGDYIETVRGIGYRFRE